MIKKYVIEERKPDLLKGKNKKCKINGLLELIWQKMALETINPQDRYRSRKRFPHPLHVKRDSKIRAKREIFHSPHFTHRVSFPSQRCVSVRLNENLCAFSYFRGNRAVLPVFIRNTNKGRSWLTSAFRR